MPVIAMFVVDGADPMEYVQGIGFIIVMDFADCTNSAAYLTGPIIFVAAARFVGYVFWELWRVSVCAGEKSILLVRVFTDVYTILG